MMTTQTKLKADNLLSLNPVSLGQRQIAAIGKALGNNRLTPWIDTNITCEPNKRYAVQYKNGTVTLSPTSPGGGPPGQMLPDGRTQGSNNISYAGNALMPSAPLGCLLGRIGGGEVFEIDYGWLSNMLQMQKPANLFLAINDLVGNGGDGSIPQSWPINEQAYTDNAGQYEVEVFEYL